MHQETQLLRHLKAAQSKRPGWAVGLWGEAGVGKTYTVQTLLGQSALKSLSLNSTLSQKTLAQQLPRPPKLPLWAEHIFERLLQDQSVNPQAVLDAMLAALSGLAPFVLFLEDLHEVSGERLEFIQSLAKAIARTKGVGLIVTSRGEVGEPFKAYRLEGLSKTGSDALLETKAQGKLPVEGLAYVFSKAHGNALFTLEFWRYLSRQGFFWSDGTHWHWRNPPEGFVPVSIEALIAAMLSDTVDEAVRGVLEARAMLGGAFDSGSEELWAGVADLAVNELAKARQSLQARGILQHDQFAHPLFGEVVLQEILAERKQLYARRALGVLSEDPLTAAEFIDAAGLEVEERLVRFKQAAEAAQARGNTAQAGRWLARAVEHAQPPERADLAFKAAQHLSSGVDFPLAIRLLEVAVSDHPAHSQALLLLATNYARSGLTSEMNRVLAQLPDDAPTQKNWAKSLLRIRHNQRDTLEVMRLWNQHPQLHADPDPDVAYCVGFAYMELNEPQKAEATAFAALQTPDLSSHQKMTLLMVCGMARRLSHDLEGGLAFMDEAVRHGRDAGPANLASTVYNRHIILSMLGRYSEAVADLRQALELYQQSGALSHYASTLSSLGNELLEMAQYQEAESRLLEAHQILSGLDHSGFLCTAEINLCGLYMSWRPPFGLTLAHKYVGLALTHAQTLEPRYRASALYVAAFVECEMGQAKRGLEVAEECLGMEQVNDQVRSQALWARATALEKLGFKDEAIQTLHQARRIAIDASVRWKIDFELAYLEHKEDLARECLEWFRQHGLLSAIDVAYRRWPELKADKESPSMASSPQVYLKVLGEVGLERHEQRLGIRGKKRLEILCYLLEARIAGRAEVDALELIDILRSDLSEARARQSLRQTIYLLRSDLGEGSIQSTPSGYALGLLNSDIEAFLRTGDSRLWRGPYLKGLADGWNANVRDGLMLIMRSSVEVLCSTDPAEAARLGQIWLEMEPYDLVALRLTLHALKLQGKTKAAEQTYQKAYQRLYEVGEVLPEDIKAFLSTPASS